MKKINYDFKKLSSIMKFGKDEIRNEEKVRMNLLEIYQELMQDDTDKSFTRLLNKINKITKDKFPKRSLMSYLPLFDELYFSKIEITEQDVITNKKEIDVLIQKFKNKINYEKVLIIKSEKVNNDAFEFIEVINKLLSKIKEQNKSELNKTLLHGLLAKEKGLKRAIVNVKSDQKNLSVLIKKVKARKEYYQKLLDVNIKMWIEIYENIPHQHDKTRENINRILKASKSIK